jgi:probable rRNA maturation factor
MACRSLQIACSSTLPRTPVRQLVTPLCKVLRRLGVNRGQWNILLVGDAAMKELHKRHLNDPTTTDVLTFDLREGEARSQKSGVRSQRQEVPRAAIELETVLCLDEARRQARARGHTVVEELLLYAVHSLLHVQGYDDVTPEQAARMHEREDELLCAIGIGSVYHKANGRPHRKSKIKKRKSPLKEPP